MYMIPLLIHLFLVPPTQAATTHDAARLLKPAQIEGQIILPSQHVVVPNEYWYVHQWTSATLPQELVGDDVRVQVWDNTNRVVAQFGTRSLDSPTLDLSMIDATAYPSIRIVLFSTTQRFDPNIVHSMYFSYNSTFNTRLVMFMLFFATLLAGTLFGLIKSRASLRTLLLHMWQGTQHAPPSHAVFASLICLSLFAYALGSYTSITHSLYLLIKIPILLYGSLLISFAAIAVVLSLFNIPFTLRSLVQMCTRVVLAVSCALASFSPLVIFYIHYPFSHDQLLAMVIVLFGIAAVAGLVTLAMLIFRSTHSRSKTLLVIGVWFIMYGSVLMQLGWMLRPWVGTRDPVYNTVPFARPYSGNVFIEIIHTLNRL